MYICVIFNYLVNPAALIVVSHYFVMCAVYSITKSFQRAIILLQNYFHISAQGMMHVHINAYISTDGVHI